MNKLYEMSRLTFVRDRDGIEAMKAFAIQSVSIYRTSAKSFFMRRNPYRRRYLESARSMRYILRYKLLEQ